MEEGKLKGAFSKVKEDIFNLGNEISEMRKQMLEMNQFLKQINEEIISLKLERIHENTQDISEKNEKTSSKTPTHNQTHHEKTPTHPTYQTQNPTHPQEIGGLKYPNFNTSIGNDGVPTDRQTNQQTNQHIQNNEKTQQSQELYTTEQENQQQIKKNVVYNWENNQENTPKEKPIQQKISEASDILDSLDAIKKEIRRQFRRVTKQEMLVFSTLYQLEEQDSEVTYSKIALKLGLSQSSIRDYMQKMISKGIPVIKEKLNNKTIILHISPDLKKIATLDTIIKLREIDVFRA